MKHIEKLIGVVIGAIWDWIAGWAEDQSDHGWPILTTVALSAIGLTGFCLFVYGLYIMLGVAIHG